MKTNVFRITKDEIEKRIESLVNKLAEAECNNVEFLRGRLGVYRDLLKAKHYWKEEEVFDPLR